MIKLEIKNLLYNTTSHYNYRIGDELPDEIRYGIVEPKHMEEYKNLGVFIDPSTTSLGMSIARLDKKAPILAIGVKRDSGRTKEDFVETYGDLLRQMLEQLKIDIVVVENQYIDPRKVNAYAALKLIMSKIEYEARVRNVKVVKILPATWKGVFLAERRQFIDIRKSNKEEIRRMAIRLIPRTLGIQNMDVYDSIGIMYYYLTKVLITNSGRRDDLLFIMYHIANLKDFKQYEQAIDAETAKGNMIEIPDNFKVINNYFFNTCDGDIKNIMKNTEKDYRRKMFVDVHKREIKNKIDFTNKVFEEMKAMRMRDNRPLDYIIHDTEASLEELAQGYGGTCKGRKGLIVTKAYKRILPEIFQGREQLGKLGKNDYFFIWVY